MLNKIKSNLLIKSMLSVVAVSTLLSACLVFWYWHQLNIKTNSQILVQRDEIVASLKESLIAPLRFHNVSDIGRVLSAYSGRSLGWGILYDSSNIPIYTVGNVPDISDLNDTYSELNLEHEMFKNMFEVKDGTEPLGKMFFGLKINTYQDHLRQEKRNLISVTILSFATMIFLLGLYARYIVDRINAVNEKILNFDPVATVSTIFSKSGDELDNIYSVFEKTALHLKDAQLQLGEKAKVEATAKLASQVAHDIRSPLSALSMVMTTLTTLPEDERVIVRNAIQRINDIANGLLQNNKRPTSSSSDQHVALENNLTLELIPALVDMLISEKRMEYRAYSGLNIEIELKNSFGSFSLIHAGELKRVISNLVNNAVEAFDHHTGKIIIAVNKMNSYIEISIIDNGKGIPSHLIDQLGREGFSYGKSSSSKSGSGLGLFHAKQTIEKFGGKLEITSIEGSGTTISIKLNLAETPSWFASSIDLTLSVSLVSLDDDLSIHQIWANRLQNFGSGQITQKQFQSGDAFKIFVQENIGNISEIQFLIDYELLNQSQTGLDLIEELKIAKDSILVTSRYEEENVQKRAKAIGLKILPKALAGFVPIEIKKEEKKYDAVLLDDDQLIRMTWESRARRNGKKLLSLEKTSELWAKIHEIDKETIFYIDVHLSDNENGEHVTKELFNLGFKNLYLATGYEADQFPHVTWIKGVVGKSPMI